MTHGCGFSLPSNIIRLKNQSLGKVLPSISNNNKTSLLHWEIPEEKKKLCPPETACCLDINTPEIIQFNNNNGASNYRRSTTSGVGPASLKTLSKNLKSKIFLSRRTASQKSGMVAAMYCNNGGSISPLLESISESRELVNITNQVLALNNTYSVQLCSQGIGGTYFIQNEQGKNIAVFKPTDEEPGAPLNPKGHIKDPLLPPGGGSIREVAAYLLDKGFAGVPETYLISDIQHPAFKRTHPHHLKTGSVQRFIENTENHEITNSAYFSVDAVHKIGILDVRLFNMDRNSENFLVQYQENNNKNNPKLIPIDHSYILPPNLSFVWFEWLHWKQAKQAFKKEHLDYIEALDIQQDAALLKQLGIELESIRTMMIATTFMKIAALQFNYNLFQIGSILSRKKFNEESELEKMVKKAETSYNRALLLLCSSAWIEDQFLEIVSSVIIEELQNKKQNKI